MDRHRPRTCGRVGGSTRMQGQSVKTGVTVTSHEESPKKESTEQGLRLFIGMDCGLYWTAIETDFDPKETHHASQRHPARQGRHLVHGSA